MRFMHWVLPVLLCLVCACEDVEPRTQITYKILASDALIARIAKLRVVVGSQQSADKTEEFTRADRLEWPVEIVVIPVLDNRSSYTVRLNVTAFDASDQLLASAQNRETAFSPRKLVSIDVPLGDDAPIRDAGAGMDAGADGGDRDSGTGQPGMDADTGVPNQPMNCATRPSEIVCDDGNDCNGEELCDPSSVAANPQGCLPSVNPIACADGMTCDNETGMCSRCAATGGDGDGDGAASISCGGNDCDDNNNTIAPGKPELCDGKDNNCDQVVDGAAADQDCADEAPTGGVATCVSGSCQKSCTNPAFQIENGRCVAPPVSCPTPNPCLPGSCAAGTDSYTCTCPAGFRAGVGMTRCAPRGVPKRTIDFENGCDGAPTPGAFEAEHKAVASNLYAACGVAAIQTGGLVSQAQLVSPSTTVIEDITGQVALVGGAVTGMTAASDDLVLAFSPGINEVTFEALDLDSAAGITVKLEAAGGAQLSTMTLAPTAGTKSARFSQQSATPIERATIHYTQTSPSDAWYIDELAIDVWGCGDGEREMPAGESCDDGNDVQCDGCDNACATTILGCQQGNACVAATPADGGLCAP